MAKIRNFLNDLSLRKSIILYILTFSLLALMLSIGTSAVCSQISERIRSDYPISGEKYYLTNEAGERLGEGAFIGTEAIKYSDRDQRYLAVLETLPLVATPIYCAFCILAAALLFYKKKLKTPLSELKMAAKKISENDLSFKLSHVSADELGELCASFEIMRSTLENNFSLMWRQAEDRQQLHAAFVHDLRTPLTVLKGYGEMLEASSDAMVKDTAKTMGKHIQRLEDYIETMSRLRSLEDSVPEYRESNLQKMLESLQSSAKVLCEKDNLELFFEAKIQAESMSLDESFLMQVADNLISNASRFARSYVKVSILEREHGLELIVLDDGEGFSKRDLENASEPYYSLNAGSTKHFGLGLYISKLLSTRHGGKLTLENTAEGAQVRAFFKTK